MGRIVTSRTSRLRTTFRDPDGQTATPDAAPTVTIAGLDAGEVVTAAATQLTGTEATYDVPADTFAAADVATVTWTAQVSGVEQSHQQLVDVTGTPLVEICDLRDRLSWATVQEVEDAILETERRICVATGWEWVPRLFARTVTPARSGPTLLEHAPVGTIVEATLTVGGDPVDTRIRATDAALVDIDAADPVLVVWRTADVHVPADLSEVALEAARHVALERRPNAGDRRGRVELGEDDRAWPMQTTSLRHGRPFGVDGIDAVVMSHDRRVVGA